VSEPARAIYVFDRRIPHALFALHKLLAPVIGDEVLQTWIDREQGRWLVLLASVEHDAARFVSWDDEAALVQFVRASLDEIGEAPVGSGPLRFQWSVSVDLNAKFAALIADHMRRFDSDVVSGTLQ
jgi:hypothetical protein